MLSERRDTSVKLTDGSSVIISKYQEEIFRDLVEMYGSLSEEALRWMRPTNEETLKKLCSSKNMILIAKHENRIIGHCMLDVYQHFTGKGISSLIVNVHQDFQNKGLGTMMIRVIIDWARSEGMRRIELGVVVEHKMAIHVYEKLGFRTEGILREAHYGMDGKYHDKLIMGLLL
jgi:RimJ/RimL family protein N-acetyltransferase